MADPKETALKDLIDGLHEDLSREYEAIIAYTTTALDVEVPNIMEQGA
jgi:hypothetical protein